MAIKDNAGIDVELVDKSQVASNPLQSQIMVASVIIAEKGLCNVPHYISNDVKRVTRFGKSNFSKFGSSATECKNVLDGKIEMYLIRPGEDDWKLAGLRGTVVADAATLTAGALTQDKMKVNASMGNDIFRIAAMGEGPWGNNLVLRFCEADEMEDADNSRIKKLEIYDFGKTYEFPAPAKDKWSVKFRSEEFEEATELYLRVNGFASTKISVDASSSVESIASSLNTALTSLIAEKGIEFEGTFAIDSEDKSKLILSAINFNVRLDNLDIVDEAMESIVNVQRLAKGTLTDADSSDWANENAQYLVEEFNVSLNSDDLDSNGSSMYLTSVLRKSNYLYALCADEALGLIEEWTGIYAFDFGEADWTASKHPSVIQLAGGICSTKEGAEPAGYANKSTRASAAKDALDKLLFRNDDLRCFITINAAHEISNSDFLAVIQNANESTLGIDSLGKTWALTEEDSLIEALKNNEIQVNHNKFLAHYWQWMSLIESTSGKTVFVSPASFVARVMGVNAQQGRYNRPPAGYNYGVISGTEEVSSDISGSNRKKLVFYKVNPIKKDADGIVIWDELTSQAGKSAFSNIHVIMAFLAMKYGIKDNLKGFEFEFNDPETVSAATRILESAARKFLDAKYAEEIKVDPSHNIYGTDEIIIYFNVRFKEVARFLRIKLVAYPSDQSLTISMANA